MKITYLATATICSGLLFLSACSSTTAPQPKPTPIASQTHVAHVAQSKDIHDAQLQLADQGYYHGAIDGVWGPLTDSAVRSFQQANHLTVTGKLDDATLTMLHDN